MSHAGPAKPIVVLYATREGQTRRIADHVAAALRLRGRSADTLDVADLPESFRLDGYAAAILAASVHVGQHEREMVTFVKRHRQELDTMPSAFLSVSMAEAGAEDPASTPEVRARSEAEVREVLDAFFQRTEWHPKYVQPVAGALLYTQYGVLVRFIMKRIARQKGATTDTSRDYDYTSWESLDRFAGEFLASMNSPDSTGTGAGSKEMTSATR